MPQLSTFHSQLSAFPAALPHTPELSLWFSVDPLSDKYPGVSPYVYCADNPVRLVDVDGREVYVTGTASDDYVAQLSTRRLIISRDETGRLSYAGKAKSRAEKQMVAAIDDKKIRVNICAENTNNIDGVPNCGLNGGAFLGCDYGYNSKEKKYVYTFQQVNLSELKKMGDDTGVGAGMFARHELTESYEGGKLSLDKKISSPMAGIQGSFYSEAHKKASFAYDLIKEKENTTIEFVIPTMQINISSYKYKIDPKYGLE